MALLATGPMDFASIRAEYGLSGAFSMGQCAGLNGSLPSSATAQVSASTFRTATRGPDTISVTKGDYNFFGTHSYGYSYTLPMGSVSSRSINEATNRLTDVYTTPASNLSVFKASAYTGIWKLWVNYSDWWASKTWDAANSRYTWSTQWWTNTSGAGVVTYYYDN